MKPKKGIVSAGHRQTAETATEILNAGGNAYDAAVSALLASFVTEPCMSSAGGGGFGNPIERDHAMIAEDLRDGYITKTAAVEVYKYPYVSDNEDKK